MPGKGGGTPMPWMWMLSGFCHQNKRRRGNYVRKGNASFAKDKATSRKTALRKGKTLARSLPKYAQLIKQKTRKPKKTVWLPSSEH
jgi:hypothetical protein